MHHDDAPSITGMADAHSNEVDVLREELAACARQSTVAEVLVSAGKTNKKKAADPHPFYGLYHKNRSSLGYALKIERLTRRHL